VLAAVEGVHTHPTADEVYRLVRKRIRTVSLGTVYRNLHLLAEEGKIREIQFHGDVVRYDGKLDTHEHFYCVSCGAVEDLPSELPATALSTLANKLGVTIERYALDYYGQCKKCKSRKS
jgi:Fe2+ or Zn2+ uptake regulation protein